MKKIIIPTDFSENSLKAFEFTNDFLTGDNFKYIVATVYDIPHGGASGLFSLMEQLRLQANKDMERFMKLLKERFPTIHQAAESTVLQGGFANEITGLANDKQADFVVMGTKGATGLKEVLLGSNAADLLNDTIIPVFAIPQEYERKNIQNIQLSYDGQSLTDNTISVIRELSQELKLPINLFHVRTNSSQGIQNWNEIVNRFKGHEVSLHEAYGETFEEGLKSEIGELNALIVLVSRKKSFWDRLMKRSESKKAIMHIHIPMLVLPEKQ